MAKLVSETIGHVGFDQAIGGVLENMMSGPSIDQPYEWSGCQCSEVVHPLDIFELPTILTTVKIWEAPINGVASLERHNKFLNYVSVLDDNLSGVLCSDIATTTSIGLGKVCSIYLQ